MPTAYDAARIIRNFLDPSHKIRLAMRRSFQSDPIDRQSILALSYIAYVTRGVDMSKFHAEFIQFSVYLTI